MEDVMFRDKVLICDECHNQFVYTVGQQRAAYQESGRLEVPRFCPVCSVKVERMGRQPMDAEPIMAEREPLMSTNGSYARNGHSHTDISADPYTNGAQTMTTFPDEVSHAPNPSQPWQPASEAPAPAASPNRPADYRSGDEHPLYGHGGETYMGSVKWFNDRKGFGFITLDTGLEIFVHYSGIAGEGYKTLKQGQRVSILVEDTGKGPQASQVTVVADDPSQGESPEA